MKNISQKDGFGCGIACAASVLGMNYESAKSLFPNSKQAKGSGFLCRDIVSALKKRGLHYEYKYVKPKIRKQIYIPGTIVFIARSKRFPAGHYLARDLKGWMDPWINFPEDLSKSKSGFRKRLPGKPIYAILPI